MATQYLGGPVHDPFDEFSAPPISPPCDRDCENCITRQKLEAAQPNPPPPHPLTNI